MSHTGRRRRSRRTYYVAACLLLLVVAATVAVATVVRPDRDGVLTLPDRVVGLDRAPAAAGPDDVADRLVDRLRAQSSVAGVGLGRYGDGDRSVVVLTVVPSELFTEETAGRLTAQLFAELEPRDGYASPRESAPSQDGLALLSCRSPEPGASACVTVEPGQALLVMATGWDGDPLGLAADVRDDVRQTPAP